MTTDQELRELVANLAKAQAKTDAQLAKTDAQLAKTDAQLAKTDTKLGRIADMYGGVSNNQGKVAEEFFYNSLKANPQLNGITYDLLEKNVTRFQNGLEDEFDVLLINGRDVAIIEVKYRAHPDHIDFLVNKKAPNFRQLFPQYASYQHHLVLASFSIEDDVKKRAHQAGVIVLQRKGDLLMSSVA
jgi:hypothetical protein